MRGLFSGSRVETEVVVEAYGARDVRVEDSLQRLPVLFGPSAHIRGSVLLHARKALDHQGVTLAFAGVIEYPGMPRTDPPFLLQSTVVLEPGTLPKGEHMLPFDFGVVSFPRESYRGPSVCVRYFFQVCVTRSFFSNIVEDHDVWLLVGQREPPELNPNIRLEVGIEHTLHLEQEYAASKFHLDDIIIGKVFFLNVRVALKYMEVGLVRREATGRPELGNERVETESIMRFEIMDGNPVSGESIPIRIPLAGLDLGPTIEEDTYSVRYYLHLILVDATERKYYKQSKVDLWRRLPADHPSTAPVAASPSPAAPAQVALPAADAREGGDDDGDAVSSGGDEESSGGEGSTTSASSSDG